MSFRITIIETHLVTKIVDEWLLQSQGGTYAYVPHEKEVRDERTVLLQEVENIDLGKIIKAINWLE